MRAAGIKVVWFYTKVSMKLAQLAIGYKDSSCTLTLVERVCAMLKSWCAGRNQSLVQIRRFV